MARSKDISGISNAVAYTAGSGAFPACRAVIATAAGTVTGTMASGAAVTSLPVVIGINAYQMTNITAATATGLFLGY